MRTFDPSLKLHLRVEKLLCRLQKNCLAAPAGRNTEQQLVKPMRQSGWQISSL